MGIIGMLLLLLGAGDKCGHGDGKDGGDDEHGDGGDDNNDGSKDHGFVS